MSSPFVTSAKQKLRVNDVSTDRPVSEAIMQKTGASINALIDSQFFTVIAEWDSFFWNTSLYDRAPIYIPKISDIIFYCLSVQDTGGNQDISAGIEVRNSSGALVTDLFGSGGNRVLLRGNNANDVMIGRDLDAGTTFSAGSGITASQFGNLSQTTIQGGNFLVPYVRDASPRNRGMRLELRLREQ